MSLFKRFSTGLYDVNTSVWGEPIISQKYLLGHSLFTFDIPKNFKKMFNGVEVLDTSLDTVITSENGRLKVTSDTLTERNTLRSKKSFRYQPNRGHFYSDSAWLPNAGNGNLYFVIRTHVGSTTTDTRTAVTADWDVTKGNVYDIQFQWRGAGDYFFYSNLAEIAKANKLGITTELTITNPALPFMFEAVKGGHTLGGLVRTNSAVRWGLGTEENGIFWEWEYEDTRDPELLIGCCETSSVGGQADTLQYTSITSGIIQSPAGEQPALAIRVPSTKDVGGNTWINTRGVILASVIASQNDESEFSIYITRDPTAITLSGATSWAFDFATDSVEYIVNDNSDVDKTFTVDYGKVMPMLQTLLELDQPKEFINPLKGQANLNIHPGDIIIFTHNTAGIDNVTVTCQLGAEI